MWYSGVMVPFTKNNKHRQHTNNHSFYESPDITANVAFPFFENLMCLVSFAFMFCSYEKECHLRHLCVLMCHVHTACAQKVKHYKLTWTSSYFSVCILFAYSCPYAWCKNCSKLACLLLKMLIYDINLNCYKCTSSALKHYGHTYTFGGNGRQAWDTIQLFRLTMHACPQKAIGFALPCILIITWLSSGKS